MKKVVIESGSRQYIVSEGDELLVDFISDNSKTLVYKPIMIIDGKDSKLEDKTLDAVKVSAKIVEEEVLSDKVISIRYKAKKRVNTKRGHRQKNTKIKITSIK